MFLSYELGTSGCCSKFCMLHGWSPDTRVETQVLAIDKFYVRLLSFLESLVQFFSRVFSSVFCGVRRFKSL